MSNWDFSPPGAGGPDEEGYLDDPEEATPYPLTYERDDFAPDPPRANASGQSTYERDDFAPRPSWANASGGSEPWPDAPEDALPPRGTTWEPWPTAPDADEDDGRGAAATARGVRPADGEPYDEPWISGQPAGRWRDAASGRRRWLIPVGVAVAGAAIGGAAVLLTSGHPGAAPAAGGRATSSVSASPTASPTADPAISRAGAPSPTAATATAPLTVAAAQRVLSAYTTANNSANAARSDTELAAIETGGSYAIDAGLYALQRAAKAAPYPAFAPVTAAYYIPRSEPAGGPRWFVVQVANAFAADPKKVTSTEYLLFTQAAPGDPWRNAVEPYLLTGATAPQIAIGRDGLATALGLTVNSLAAAPGQLAARTADSLDGSGGGIYVTSASPGLADRAGQTSWQGKLPGARVHDAHAAATGAAGQTFALGTTNGGALVFYTDTAELTFTPPAGSTLRLNVPGLYSATQALTSARLAYLDQFAAYDPPASAGPAMVIATYSGITGKN